jgi:hypothetical protein
MREKKRLLGGVAVVIVVGAIGLGLINPLGSRSVSELRQSSNSMSTGSYTGDGGCGGGHPIFHDGFAELHARLGDIMGIPIECEQPIHVSGDTRQRTTTGYAYYRKSDNIPTFTNGWDHWALTADGLVYWSGDVVDPPTAESSRGG